MPRNYWMFVQTPENFEVSRGLSFTVHGLKSRYRRRAQRMAPDDRVLFYISETRKWAATASITSRYFEDRTPIWSTDGNQEVFPYRVKLSPSIVLKEEDYVDALILGPRLEYVKRWAPESWPLAFMDSLHLLPQRDFRLIEGEMKRIMSRGRKRRRRGRVRGRSGSDGGSINRPQRDSAAEEADGATVDASQSGAAAEEADGATMDAPQRDVAAEEAGGAATDAPQRDVAAEEADGATTDAPQRDVAAEEAGGDSASDGPAADSR